MDFNSTLNFFEGSIFSEEFVGNFSKIRQRVEELQAGDLDHPEQKAWVKFLKSIFSMLTGDLTKAFTSLREISLIQNLPPKWLLRTATYDAFYTSLRLCPSVIRFRPFLGSPTAAFQTEELGFSEICEEYQKTLNEYLATDLPLFRFEGQILIFMLTASYPLWNNAFIQHPIYPRGPWEALKAKSLQDMSAREKIFKANRKQAISLGIHQLDKYMSRLQIEIEYGKSLERSKMVESTKNRYRTFVDKHNLAIIKMIEADHVISPPFSNPIALNLLLIEDADPGRSITPWNSVEDKLKVGDIDLAGQLYEQADHLFTDIASPRGCAAVLLRQGCVEHIRTFARDVSLQERIRRYATARQKFAESLRLFELDEAHSQIVRGHQILLSITSGEDSNITEAAAAIGSWGRISSNEMISRFVGILMHRFGRRQMLDYARNDIALKCYRCAQSCFASLGDRLGELRALSSELYLLKSMNDHLATRLMIEKPKEVFRELLVYLGKMELEHPSTKSICESVKRDMIMNFGKLISLVHHDVGDFEAFEQWEKDLQAVHLDQTGKDEINRSAKMTFNKYSFREKGLSDDLPPLLRRPDFSVTEETSRTGLSSILPFLSRVVLGNPDSSVPLPSLSDYVKEGLDAHEKYMKASSEWRQALNQFDIDSAHCQFHKYISDAAPNDISSHPENLFPIFAAAEMGELEMSRRILRNMLNSKFLDSDVHHSLHTGESALQTSESTLQEYLEIDNVLAACALSRDWDLASQLLRRIRKFYPQYVEIDVERTPITNWSRLAYVGVIYERSNLPLEAFTLLSKASQLAEQDRSLVSDPNSRRGIFASSAFGEIFHSLARLCLHAGELGIPLAVLEAYPHNNLRARTWQEHALFFLEQVKARNLLEYLAANQQDPIDTDGKASRALKRKQRTNLLALNPLSDSQKEELKTLETQLEAYEDDLNQLESMLDRKTSTVNNEDLYRAIGEDEIVIEADFSGHGFTLFGVTSTGIEFAQHRHRTWYEMRDLVSRVKKHLTDYPMDQAPDARADLEVLLKAISDELILPLQDLIRRKKHVIFIASQPLAAFPYSVLLLDDEPLFLRVAVSQAPSLGTLLQLWKSNRASESSTETFRHPVSVSTIVKPAKLLKTKSKTPQESVLFLAAVEAMIVARTFNSWPLDATQISRSDFQSLIQRGNLGGTNEDDARMRILHIGTHGDYDPVHPWQSSISLKEQFRVLDIDHTKPRGHRRSALIVFAACLSGMGQATLGNDVLGFAQAMLERDCNAYLGALWSVDDHSSMLLMVLFYQHLYRSVVETPTPSASVANLWQEAQRSLYHLTIESARELIDGLVKVLEGAKRDGHDPKMFVNSWKLRLESVVEKMEGGKLDLKHPFNYGAFVVVGYGGMALVPPRYLDL